MTTTTLEFGGRILVLSFDINFLLGGGGSYLESWRQRGFFASFGPDQARLLCWSVEDRGVKKKIRGGGGCFN